MSLIATSLFRCWERQRKKTGRVALVFPATNRTNWPITNRNGWDCAGRDCTTWCTANKWQLRFCNSIRRSGLAQKTRCTIGQCGFSFHVEGVFKFFFFVGRYFDGLPRKLLELPEGLFSTNSIH